MTTTARQGRTRTTHRLIGLVVLVLTSATACAAGSSTEPRGLAAVPATVTTTQTLSAPAVTETAAPETTTRTVTRTVTRTATRTVTARSRATATAAPLLDESDSGGSAGSAHYANCSAARAASAAPIHRGEPGYRAGLDRDGDGVGCE